VLRLASLLWRMRRATMIETKLLRIQAEVLRDRRSSQLAVRSRNAPSPILGNAYSAFQDVQEDQTNSDSSLAGHSAARLAPQPINLRETSRIASNDLPISTVESSNGWDGMCPRSHAKLCEFYFR
jgi:hypothetical protein